MSELGEIRNGWNAAANADAMYNILTLPDKIGGGWTADEFYAHGREEVDATLARIDEVAERRHRRRALDFGCGVGRLTLALGEHYDHVLGVDISRRMTKIGRHWARVASTRLSVKFATSAKPDLRWLGAARFDLVYSVITLQHLPPHLQRGYVSEFIRVLEPGGLAVFQLTEGPTLANGHLSMYSVEPETAAGWIDDAGGTIVHAEASAHSGDGFTGRLYVVER